MTNTIAIRKGFMDFNFYNNHLKKEITSKKWQNVFKKYEDIFKNEGEFIEYKVISFPDNHLAYYHQLWFLEYYDKDDNSKYYPIYISNINTSSYYALESCSMEYDEDEDEDEEITVEEIMELCPCETSKKSVVSILEKHGIKENEIVFK